MSTNDDLNPADASIECGLLVNPLAPDMATNSRRTTAEALVTHAMSARLLTAVRRSAATEDSKPIWLERGVLVPPEYHLATLAETTRVSTRPEDVGVLLVYVPLTFMRAGRVRAALSAFSDRLVGGPGFELVLGNYVASALREPDAELPEWAPLPAEDVAAYLARIEEDPTEAVREIYGPHDLERGSEDLRILARLSGARQSLLGRDPDASDETVETDSDTESLADALELAHIDPMEVAPAQLEAGETADEDEEHARARKLADDLALYVEAHARAHLSPVIARCLSSYRSRGYAAATEEIKVTKAPRKTLGAVARLARYGYKAVLVMFDQFSGWEAIPRDLRHSIASALLEMRWAMEGSACVVISSSAGETPEVEEQFAAATKVDWDMEGLPEWGTDNKPSELPLAMLFDAATLCPPAPVADDPVIALAMERAGDDAAEFCRIAGFAVAEAMASGSATLDAASLDRVPEVEPEPEIEPEIVPEVEPGIAEDAGDEAGEPEGAV